MGLGRRNGLGWLWGWVRDYGYLWMVLGVIRIVFRNKEPSLEVFSLGLRLMAYNHLRPDTNNSFHT
jgi:DMSO/TMAO reductase YedYZ heme-binding membrane subunit